MGRSRWKVIGYAVLVVVVMFVANTIGQLWEPAGFVRPLTFFFYYQPQRVMIDGDWLVDLNKAWNLGGPVMCPRPACCSPSARRATRSRCGSRDATCPRRCEEGERRGVSPPVSTLKPAGLRRAARFHSHPIWYTSFTRSLPRLFRNMPASPWLTLRQTQEAVAAGRPEERTGCSAAAGRGVPPRPQDGARRGEGLPGRAGTLDLHNPEAAWRDLLSAESLTTGDKAVAELRHTLTRFSMVQVRAMLEAGRPIDTIDHIAKCRDRGVRHPDLELLEAAAQDWIAAQEFADRGEFPRGRGTGPRLAEVAVAEDRAGPLPGGSGGPERGDSTTRSAGSTHAAEAKRWREAVAIAAEVLAAARRTTARRRRFAERRGSPRPRKRRTSHRSRPLARSPRRWPNRRRPSRAGAGPPAADGRRAPAPAGRARIRRLVQSPLLGRRAPLPKRFLLWVDGVGGYLVCLSNRGSRSGRRPPTGRWTCRCSRTCRGLHAEVTRDGEGYVIESSRGIRVNGERDEADGARAPATG